MAVATLPPGGPAVVAVPEPIDPLATAGAERAAPAPAAEAAPSHTTGVLAVCAALFVLATACASFLGGAQPPRGASFLVPSWAFLVMFALAEVVVLHVQVRREAMTISLSEIPLMIGCFAADLPGLVIARVIGPLLVFVFYRRQRNALKLVFNTTLVVTDLLAALATFHLIAGDAVTGGRVWLGAYAALAVFAVVDAGAMLVIIRLHEAEMRIRALVSEVVLAVAMSAAVGTLGIVTVTSLDADTTSAWPLTVGGVVLLVAYRGYARLTERHVSLERMYRFSQVVSASSEVEQVLRSVLEQARDLLRAEWAEVTIMVEPNGTAVRTTLDASGVLCTEEIHEDAADWATRQALSAGVPILAPRRTRDEELRTFLTTRGHREAIVVPLGANTVVHGTIGVANRLSDVRTFDDSDVRLLETIANHAAIALRHGRLIDQLRYDALHDSLTGLPNRAMLQRCMREALAGLDASRTTSVATLLLDLDGFKDVNDSLGHQQGDVLLVETAARLREAAGPGATVARLGGDEFAVLLPSVSCAEDAVAVARRMLDALDAPFKLADLELAVSGSIGVAVTSQPVTASELLKQADLAMYAAKNSNGGVRLYDDRLDQTRPERLALLAELRQAIATNALRIDVQPKAQLHTREVVGVEVLARWDHPQHGSIPPDEFVPVAERSGLIGPMTFAVLDAALVACASWLRAGREIGVAVNLSPRALLDGDLVDDVSELLRRRRVPPHLLTLEITETSVMSDPDRSLPVLAALHRMGVRLSLDDFGTGYSSLSYLHRIPVDEVKIDRSFVTDLGSRAEGESIVRSIIDLSDNLSLRVVAEGVEDETTWTQLAAMGCEQAQGYYLSRPIAVTKLLPWLEAHEAATRVAV